MADSAYEFIGICSIFPFIYIFIFAGFAALLIVGLVLLIQGAKSKWADLINNGRAFKIIKIIIGASFLVIVTTFAIYTAVGFTEMINRGGLFGGPKTSSNPEQSNALIYYLSMIL